MHSSVSSRQAAGFENENGCFLLHRRNGAAADRAETAAVVHGGAAVQTGGTWFLGPSVKNQRRLSRLPRGAVRSYPLLARGTRLMRWPEQLPENTENFPASNANQEQQQQARGTKTRNGKEGIESEVAQEEQNVVGRTVQRAPVSRGGRRNTGGSESQPPVSRTQSALT